MFLYFLDRNGSSILLREREFFCCFPISRTESSRRRSKFFCCQSEYEYQQNNTLWIFLCVWCFCMTCEEKKSGRRRKKNFELVPARPRLACNPCPSPSYPLFASSWDLISIFLFFLYSYWIIWKLEILTDLFSVSLLSLCRSFSKKSVFERFHVYVDSEFQIFEISHIEFQIGQIMCTCLRMYYHRILRLVFTVSRRGCWSTKNPKKCDLF